MRVTVIPIVVGALGTVPKVLERILEKLKIRGRIKTIQMTEFFRSTWILRRDNRMTIPRKQKWEEKQLYGHFKWLIKNISHEKTWTWLRKGNFKRETESLLIAEQNNAIRTNHIKTKIDKTQQNSQCMLCGNRDETTNHIISECSKLAQKEYKTRPDWVGKVIHWEMCDIWIWPYQQMVYAQPSIYPRKWHTQTPMGLWHTHGSPNLGQKTRPYNNQQKKRTCKIVNFAVPADHRIKLKECEKKISTSTLLGNWKNYMEHESDNYTNHDWCFWYSHQRTIKGTGGLGSWRTSGDHPNYSRIFSHLLSPENEWNGLRDCLVSCVFEKGKLKFKKKNINSESQRS